MAVLLLVAAICTDAQTKIFREVGDEISSHGKGIRQEDVLFGYLLFTQLEKLRKTLRLVKTPTLAKKA